MAGTQTSNFNKSKVDYFLDSNPYQTSDIFICSQLFVGTVS